MDVLIPQKPVAPLPPPPGGPRPDLGPLSAGVDRPGRSRRRPSLSLWGLFLRAPSGDQCALTSPCLVISVRCPLCPCPRVLSVLGAGVGRARLSGVVPGLEMVVVRAPAAGS